MNILNTRTVYEKMGTGGGVKDQPAKQTLKWSAEQQSHCPNQAKHPHYITLEIWQLLFSCMQTLQFGQSTILSTHQLFSRQTVQMKSLSWIISRLYHVSNIHWDLRNPFTEISAAYDSISAQVHNDLTLSLICAHGKRVGARLRWKRYQAHMKLMETINKRERWFTLNKQNLKKKEEDIRKCCHRRAHEKLLFQELKARDRQLQEGLSAVQRALRSCCSTLTHILSCCQHEENHSLAQWSTHTHTHTRVQACRWWHRSLSFFVSHWKNFN